MSDSEVVITVDFESTIWTSNLCQRTAILLWLLTLLFLGTFCTLQTDWERLPILFFISLAFDLTWLRTSHCLCPYSFSYPVFMLLMGVSFVLSDCVRQYYRIGEGESLYAYYFAIFIVAKRPTTNYSIFSQLSLTYFSFMSYPIETMERRWQGINYDGGGGGAGARHPKLPLSKTWQIYDL